MANTDVSWIFLLSVAGGGNRKEICSKALWNQNGGEGGILVPPFLLSDSLHFRDNPYFHRITMNFDCVLVFLEFLLSL